MSALVVTALLLVAVAGGLVVATRDPARQAVVLSVFGLLLAVLFTTLQAPDVAMSQLVVGAAVVPLMLLLAVTTMRGGR